MKHKNYMFIVFHIFYSGYCLLIILFFSFFFFRITLNHNGPVQSCSMGPCTRNLTCTRTRTQTQTHDLDLYPDPDPRLSQVMSQNPYPWLCTWTLTRTDSPGPAVKVWPCHTWPDRPYVYKKRISQCSFYVILMSAKYVRAKVRVIRRYSLQIHSRERR